MSNSGLFMACGYPIAASRTHIGFNRTLCALQRVTLKFCKSSGDSRGMREFLEHDLLDFAKAHPGIVVYVKPRRHRSPNLTAEYLNGAKQVINCHNYTRDEINKWINLLRTESGRPAVRFMKLWHTDHPSIQGPWNPFTNRDPQINICSFPNEGLSRSIKLKPSATERLVELFKQQQAMESRA